VGQVKLPDEVKREVEIVAGLTGRSQSELLADSWREYRQHHESEFQAGLRRAAALLSEPTAAAVAASGMSEEQLKRIDEAFSG
jgi:predicted transcriptional regulator